MPHGGYHGKVVGLGSKPSSRQPGIEQSNTSKSKNTPQQKKDKGIMARKKAAQSMASQGILNLAGDVTANKAGRKAGIKQMDSKSNFNVSRPASYIQNNPSDSDLIPTINEDKQITETKGSGINKKRITKDTNYEPSFLSKTRDFATKAGVPIVFSQFAYSLMGRNKQNVPLTLNNFNKKETNYIKNYATEKLKEKYGNKIPANTPLVISYYAGNPFDINTPVPFHERSVGSTLGDATAYINNNGELIVTDYYDWQTGIDLTNPDTSEAPVNLDEWRYTVVKQFDFYLNDPYGKEVEADYMRPYKKDDDYYAGEDPRFESMTDEQQIKYEKVKDDVYSVSSLLMDAAESLANIIGPKKYEQNSIFEVPEEKRTILNLGKIQ